MILMRILADIRNLPFVIEIGACKADRPISKGEEYCYNYKSSETVSRLIISGKDQLILISKSEDAREVGLVISVKMLSRGLCSKLHKCLLYSCHKVFT